MKISPIDSGLLLETTETIESAAGQSAAGPRRVPDASWSDRDLFRALPGAAAQERGCIEDLLIRRHCGLVRWIAARYANPLIDPDELLQVGYLGLVLAIRRFDVERGHEFAAFARPTVQGEIRRWFRDKRRWIRLPRPLQEAKATLRESTEVLTHRLARAPTIAELAEHSCLSVDLVREALAADDNFAPASLDAPAGAHDDESFTIADTIGDHDPRIELVIDCDSLRPLLAGLTERERHILHMRFYQNLTQAQIGRELGLSQMHISRTLSRTLNSLHRRLHRAQAAG
jgi:RNA polymerase sigma-B factor